jgi:hypothetical protein
MYKRHTALLLGFACLASASAALAQTGQPEAAPALSTGPIQSVTVNWQRNPSKWFRAESQHVVVYSDTDSEDVTRLLNNLERLDYLLRVYTKGYAKTGAADTKLTLYYAKRIEDLGRLGLAQPAESVGLYNSCAAGVNGFGAQLTVIGDLKDEELPKAELNASLSHLFEGYARHFLYRHTDLRAPAWFIDGFAQYFSSVRFSDGQLIVGRTPTGIGAYLNFLENGRRRSLDYKDVLEDNDKEGVSYGGKAGLQLEFQARSWLLVHYILSSEDNRRRLGVYLKTFYDGVPSVQAFEAAFGIPVANLATDMWRYRLQAAKVLRAEQQALPRANVNFDSLPQSAGDFVLADALLRSCPDAGQRRALLDTLHTEAGRLPNSAFAQLTLSRALVETGRAADALPYLDKAARSDEANAELHYLTGLAHLRVAQQAQAGSTERASHLAAAQRSLARAASLNAVPSPASATPAIAPASASTIALATLQADLLTNGDPSQPALEGVIGAWRRTRDVGALGKAAVLAYAWQGDGISSANLLRSMASNRRDPDTAAWAQTWQKRLDAGLTRAAIRDGLMADPWSTAAFREWTIANENVADYVTTRAGLEDAQQFYDKSGDPAKGEPQIVAPHR